MNINDTCTSNLVGVWRPGKKRECRSTKDKTDKYQWRRNGAGTRYSLLLMMNIVPYIRPLLIRMLIRTVLFTTETNKHGVSEVCDLRHSIILINSLQIFTEYYFVRNGRFKATLF